jgi:preprotein translocase subunit SecB
MLVPFEVKVGLWMTQVTRTIQIKLTRERWKHASDDYQTAVRLFATLSFDYDEEFASEAELEEAGILKIPTPHGNEHRHCVRPACIKMHLAYTKRHLLPLKHWVIMPDL